jgi:DNA-binding MarR family transcriptional regulator
VPQRLGQAVKRRDHLVDPGELEDPRYRLARHGQNDPAPRGLGPLVRVDQIRDIAAAVGLTERSVQAIVADHETAGYLTRTRHGRRTRYTVNHDSLFRHSAQEGLRVGPFLDLLSEAEARTTDDRSR